jgi:integrase
MNISYKLVGSKSLKKIYIRLYQGDLDLLLNTNLVVDSIDWNKKLLISKSNIGLNEKLQELRLFILKRFNNDFSQGVIIDKNWLIMALKQCFCRPINEIGLINKSHEIYFSDFCKYWLDNHSKYWKTSVRKTMSKVLISQYNKFYELFLEFEQFSNEKIQLKDFTQEKIYEFIDYLKDLEFANSTTQRNLGRLIFYLNRAIECKFIVNPDFKKRIYLDKDDDSIESVYLNEAEIQTIFELNLSHDDYLDSVRDNLILSCWTALRVSDLMFNLKIDNIKNGVISIKTKKTGSFVKIPVHPQVQFILNKRFGQLPEKITASDYNLAVKKVGQLANLDNLIYGKLWNSDKKRKEINYFPKYKYLSSHIGRKSLISNLKGKVSDDLLQNIGGWQGKEMMEFYNKTNKTEYANELRDFWNKTN